MPIQRGVGAIRTLADVQLQSGSDILLDGVRDTSTSSFRVNLVGTTTLGDISTYNRGTGDAGWIVINPIAAGLSVGEVIASATNGTAGNVQIFGTGAGNISIGHVEASSSGADRQGAHVFLSTSGTTLSVSSVNVSGKAGARGGTVQLTSTGDLRVGSATADSDGKFGLTASGTTRGGNVYLQATGSIVNPAGTTFNIDASSSAGQGGNVVIAANGNDGSGTAVRLQNVDVSGVTGGRFWLASTDLAGTPGSTTLGSVTAQGTGSTAGGGAVTVQSLGDLNITGSISTENTAAVSTGRSGSVFLSSGGNLSNNAIVAHNIGNGSTSGNVVRVASGTITGTAPVTGAGQSGTFASFTGPATISSAANVDVILTPGMIQNYNPQGFTTVSITGGGQLRFDTGGDDLLIAPVISRSTISIGSSTRLNTVNAGSYALLARGDISTTGIDMTGTNSGGTVAVMSAAGSVNIAGINTLGGPSGGDVLLFAPAPTRTISIGSSASLGSINTSGTTQSGEIVGYSGGGMAFASQLRTISAGTAGNISLTANTGNLDFNGLGGQFSELFRNIYAVGGTGNGGTLDFVLGRSVTVSSRAGVNNNSTSFCCSIAPSFVTNSTSGRAGDINLNIVSGDQAFNPSAVNMPWIAASSNGTGGNINIAVGGNYSSNAPLYTDGRLAAGNVRIDVLGNVNGNFSSGVYSPSGAGSGGNVEINSRYGTIVFPWVYTNGQVTGGNVSISTPYRTIDLQSSYDLASIETTGLTISGNVSLIAGGDIRIASGIRTGSPRNGGDVSIFSEIGSLNIGSGGTGHLIDATGSAGGDGGAISLLIGEAFSDSPAVTRGIIGNGSFSTSSPQGNAGNITVDFRAGNLNPGSISLNATSNTGNGGNIVVAAGASATLNWSLNSSGVRGGDITITSPGSYSNTGTITANGYDGRAGNVTITAGSISQNQYIEARGVMVPPGTAQSEYFGGNITLTALTGSLSVTGFNTNGAAIDASARTRGGRIALTSYGDIVVSNINSSSQASAGDVSLAVTNSGNVRFASNTAINATGTSSNGGNVSITVNNPVADAGFIGVFSNTDPTGCCTVNTIDASSTSGVAGSISIAVSNGQLGYFGGVAGRNTNMTLNANSSTNSAGSISVTASSDIRTQWTMNASGATGGNITLNAGNALTNTANLTATGSVYRGGNVFAMSSGTLTLTPAIVNVSGSATSVGGNVSLTSQTANVAAGAINISAVRDAGTAYIFGRTGVTTSAQLNASSSAAVGGTVVIATAGPAAAIALTGVTNTINASGATRGGNVGIVSAGLSTFSSSVNANGTGAGSQGGNIFISQGALANLAVTASVTGTANGTSVLMSGGTINGSGVTAAGLFPNVTSTLTAGDIQAGSNYVITVTPAQRRPSPIQPRQTHTTCRPVRSPASTPSTSTMFRSSVRQAMDR